MDNFLMAQVHLRPQLRLGDGIFGSDHDVQMKIVQDGLEP
jgi:hypothetical protein